MTDLTSRFGTALHRIEVHAGATAFDPVFIWKVTARKTGDDGLRLLGYLRRVTLEGFGQAQAVGTCDAWSWSEITASEESRDSFATWVAQYASDVMYDTARRALLAQAGMMELTLDLEPHGPETVVEFTTPKDSPTE